LLPVVGLIALLAVAPLPAFGADPSGEGGGTLGVTVIDPTATESPTPTPSPSPGTSTPGGGSGGSGGSGGTPTPSGTPSPEPTAVAEGGGWIVVSGVDASAHAQFNPFGGWVSASVGISNKSATDTARGDVTFRLYDPLGRQIGSKVSHTVTGIAPGESQTVNARLDDVGQWPLVRVVATFTPDASETSTTDMDPISRESWVPAFPWVLLVVLILLLATGIIVGLRRGSFTRSGSGT